MDINLKKTFAMIVTNKRVTLPKEIVTNGLSVQAFESFRLLEVTIDRKLYFPRPRLEYLQFSESKAFFD